MTNLPALREAVAQMTEGPWVVDPQFGLDIVRAVDIGKPHGGGATPELDARYAWVIATVRADWPFDGCEAFTRRKFKGQQEPEADAAGIVALRNAAPSLLDEVERVRAEHEYQLCEAQRWAGRAEQAEADLAALKARTLNIARGCHDYGGGHHGDGMMDAYQHGIQTVVNALTAAFQDRPNDFQTATLERLGAEAAKEQA